MELNSTFYPNVSRTIIGSGNLVFPNDVILLCDTTLNPVDLTLAEIPSGAWNTTYKLYIVDSGNASANNITINAPVGFTINDQPTLTISTNNGSAIIRIAKDKGYLGSLSSGGGGSLEVLNQGVSVTTSAQNMNFVGIQAILTAPNSVQINNAFISGTGVAINTLASGGLLIANQWYNITDADYGYFAHDFNVYVPAITNNSLSTLGIGEFFNADYDGFGDYSGIVGFSSQLGIWLSTLAPVVNDVCIWNNLHYLNITGVNGVFDPSIDVVNWQLLTYSKTNGYLLEYNEIVLGFKNRIYYRKDQWNNEVEHFDYIGSVSSFDKFPFGNNKVQGNKVLSGSYWDFCNTIIGTSVFNNTLLHTLLIWDELRFIDSCQSNNFFGTIRPLEWKIGNSALVVAGNDFNICQGTSILEETALQDNSFSNSSIALNLSGGCNFFQNQLISATISMTKTHADFSNNTLIHASLTSGNSTGTEMNNVLSHCQLNLPTNEGIVEYNEFFQNSIVQITNIGIAGKFSFNKIDQNSVVTIGDLQSFLGDGGVKGIGNYFSDCQIDLLSFTGQMYANNICNTEMSIDNFSGTIANCQFFGESQITIQDMNNKTMTFLTCEEFTYGSAGWTMPESYNGGVYNYGLASIKCTIDCADPLIYDPLTFTLTIPNELRKFAGVYILTNANAIDIKKITNTFDKAPYTFFNDNGSTKFITTAVGVALGGDLIDTTPAPAIYNIQYRLNGSDYIVFNRSGFLMGIVNTYIFQ